MNVESRLVVVAVLDGLTSRIKTFQDEDVALTLIAVASEDPNCWDDIVAYWPRYHTPAVCEFVDSLAFDEADQTLLDQTNFPDGSWVTIDLVQKRILTGPNFTQIDHDQILEMSEEASHQQIPLSIHLPPWWELIGHTDANAIFQKRVSSISIPNVNRDVLMGDSLLNDLASRILWIATSERWLSKNAKDERATYDFTVEVHRDWLMTPRNDLNGLMPRKLLHGAHNWIERLVGAQRLRFQDDCQMVAAPDDVAHFDIAPMGLEEMVTYFDLCRELINTGWKWCIGEGIGRTAVDNTESSHRHGELVKFLRDAKELWLASSFEGGPPPSFTIECSRRRVPVALGVPIAGMAEPPTEEHVADCDCPICNMIADGMFGPSFSFMDGHHLELDDEFAFSTRESFADWQSERYIVDDSMKTNGEPTIEKNKCENDPFESVWSSPPCENPLPGDPAGHMKLAFLATEIVSLLQSTKAAHEDIEQLNANFNNFRSCDAEHRTLSGQCLNDHIESLGHRYPILISRIADFQSRINEQTRQTMP